MSKKNYIVQGKTFIALVSNIDTDKFLTENDQFTEAATQALEAYLKNKENENVEIKKSEPISELKVDNVYIKALIQLMNDEIERTGIGAVVAISPADNIEDERFMSSKTIFENIGMPEMIKLFDKKFPEIKDSKKKAKKKIGD